MAEVSVFSNLVSNKKPKKVCIRHSVRMRNGEFPVVPKMNFEITPAIVIIRPTVTIPMVVAALMVAVIAVPTAAINFVN